MSLHTTPSATVGPFWSIGLSWADGPHAVAPDVPGAIWIRGKVLDGAGQPLAVGLVETWQADPDGRFDHPDDPRGAERIPGFRGFGRTCTDSDGRWGVHTVRPGAVPGDADRPQAPHLDVSVFARGLLHRLVTRIYLGDEEEANAADPVLSGLDTAARVTLVAAPASDGYRHDIVLQGEGETVFFRV